MMVPRDRGVQPGRRSTPTRGRRKTRRRPPERPLRQLDAFSRLEALDAQLDAQRAADAERRRRTRLSKRPAQVVAPSIIRPPALRSDVSPVLRVVAESRAESPHREAISAATADTRSTRSRRPTVIRRLALASTAGALGAATLVASPAAANPLPASPPIAVQAPIIASAITGLSQGTRGDAVRSLQQALIGSGVNVVGGADGIFGPMTRSAVEQFQSRQGLPVTGVVDDATAAALASSGSGTDGGADSGSNGSDSGGGSIVGLTQGAQGPLVEALQRALIDKGVWLPSVSGIFGASTQRGVRQFQGWNGLGVTGTVTQATAKALGLDGSGGSTPTPTAPPAPTPADTGGTPSTASSEYVGLNRGDRGPLVADVQRAIISAGISVRGGADGVFGPMTQAALVSFQRARGLSPTGVVGAADVEALGLSAGEPVAPPATDQFIGLSQGSRGDAVKQLQQALIDAGLTVRGGADGVFGPVTKTALSTYQGSQGLIASGVVDEATTERLGLGSGNGPQPYSPAPAEGPDHDHGDDHADDPAPSDNPYVGLGRGASGPLVKELQQALQRLEFVVVGGADGSFGPATETTLKAFQSVNGIPQTGVVTERGAQILGLGSGQNDSDGEGGSAGTPSFQMERFPVQGLCFFGDTWHAPRGGGRLHVGTDIIADEGKLLYAVVDGTISKMYWDQPGALAGNGVRVAQDDGTYFTYLHMQGFAPGIEVGTKVKAGDVIGWIGNTGSSATPHLHFEIHPGGGAAINPYPYLKAMDDCANTTPQYQSSFAPSE